jgi:ribosomal protein L37AE/L43A
MLRMFGSRAKQAEEGVTEVTTPRVLCPVPKVPIRAVCWYCGQPVVKRVPRSRLGLAHRWECDGCEVQWTGPGEGA